MCTPGSVLEKDQLDRITIIKDRKNNSTTAKDWKDQSTATKWLKALEEISTQNGPFNFNSNSMSSCVSQWNFFKFEIPCRS